MESGLWDFVLWALGRLVSAAKDSTTVCNAPAHRLAGNRSTAFRCCRYGGSSLRQPPSGSPTCSVHLWFSGGSAHRLTRNNFIFYLHDDTKNPSSSLQVESPWRILRPFISSSSTMRGSNSLFVLLLFINLTIFSFKFSYFTSFIDIQLTIIIIQVR